MRCLPAVLLFLGTVCLSSCEYPAQCLVEWDSNGQCMTGRATWTYDVNQMQCIEVPMYGCLGSDNVFSTEDECISTCVIGEERKPSQLANLLSGDVLHKDPRIVNEIMDKVFSLVSDLIKSIGKDPVSLPDLTTDSIPHLEIGFKDGSVAGFSNIVRQGDWGFSMDGITKYRAQGGVAINNLNISYKLLAKLFGIGGEAGVSASVHTFGIAFDFFLDVTACTIGLEDFTIGEIANIEIDFDAISFLDPVLKSVSEFFSNSLMEVITTKIEETIKETVGSVNVCQMIVPLIG